jgi:hypothetical protein
VATDTETLAPAPARAAARTPVTTASAATPGRDRTVSGAIRGAVDNVGARKIYGWAWYPDRPDERLTIEVRLGKEVMITSIADFARTDLPQAGIGDGNHAFEIELNAECVARRNELQVVARSADGSEAALAFRVKRTPELTAAATQRNLEQLAAAQKDLREEMRAALAQVARGANMGRGAESAAAQIAAAQAKLDEKLATLDVWLTRLDLRLAELAEGQQGKPGTNGRRVDTWQIVLGAVLGVAGAGALAVSVLLLRAGGGI